MARYVIYYQAQSVELYAISSKLLIPFYGLCLIFNHCKQRMQCAMSEMVFSEGRATHDKPVVLADKLFNWSCFTVFLGSYAT